MCIRDRENSIGFWSDANPTTTSCAEQLSSDVGVVRGQWNHIAVVVDETHHTNDVFFYINGQPAGHRRSHVLGRINRPTDESGAGLVIGQGPCPAGCLSYKGHMDEVTMYNAKWSPQEIATWWNRSIESEETRDAFPHFEKGRIGYVFNLSLIHI